MTVRTAEEVKADEYAQRQRAKAKADAPRCPTSWWMEPMTRDEFDAKARTRVEDMRKSGVKYNADLWFV
jgi:hypothetical protein